MNIELQVCFDICGLNRICFLNPIMKPWDSVNTTKVIIRTSNGIDYQLIDLKDSFQNVFLEIYIFIATICVQSIIVVWSLLQNAAANGVKWIEFDISFVRTVDEVEDNVEVDGDGWEGEDGRRGNLGDCQVETAYIVWQS